MKSRVAGSVKELLSDHDTRLLLGSQWMAQSADGLVQAVFANELILEPDGTPSRIVAVAALTLLPYSLIAPFLGVFVDRWRRRPLLVGTNALRAVLLVLLSIVGRLVDGDLILYTSLLVLLGLGRLFLTTKGAALPVILHEHHLLKGNALSGGGGMIAALAGGVVGVGAATVLSTDNSLLIVAVVYGLSSLMASRISDPLAHGTSPGAPVSDAFSRVLGELQEGSRAIWSRMSARLPLLGIFIVRTAGMVAAFSAILIIKDQYPDAGDKFGRLSSGALALGAAGVGAMMGALFAPALGRRFREPNLMLIGFCVSGAGIVALGGIEDIYAVLGLTFFGGLGSFLAKVAVDAQLQRALPDDFRGRGFALYDILFNQATVLAAFLVYIATELSPRTFLMAVGATTLLGAGLLAHLMSRHGLLVSKKESPALPIG